MFRFNKQFFILLGFLLLWSALVSLLIWIYVKVNFLIIFFYVFLSFSIFSLLLSKLYLKFNSISEIEDIAEEESIETKLQSNEREEDDNKGELIERISVKTGSRLDVINIADTMFIQANGDYVSIYAKDNVYLKEQRMKYYQEKLPKDKFLRIHRSYIVNIEFINSIENYKKNQFIITLKNEHQIKASQTGYKLLKDTLGL